MPLSEKINIAEKDRFARLAGIRILEVSKGLARTAMDISDCHRNALGMVHGGAIFTLADLAFALAANAEPDVTAVAVNVNISYLKSSSKGVLYAEAREISVNRKIGTYAVTVTDETEAKIAFFQGMAYRKKHKEIELYPC